MTNKTELPIWRGREVLALMEGILTQAVESVFDGRTGASVHREIQSWIESDAMHPFSFRVCCIAAGCDPDKLRCLLRRKRHRIDRAA